MGRSLCRFLPGLLLVAAGTVAADGPSELVFERKAGHLRYYRGSVLLEGVAERYTDKETLGLQGDNLCFVVAGPSQRYIPREGDTRVPWFCFSDRKAALLALKLPDEPAKGTCGYRVPATVVVGDYAVNRQESAVFDTATLIAVRSRGAVSAIACK
ncbi:MAG: hypothetical protein QM750_01430 [Rubrivivax sp.]